MKAETLEKVMNGVLLAHTVYQLSAIKTVLLRMCIKHLNYLLLGAV